nr:hypothetical protein [Tanacetum cinerariifolium]
VRVFCWGEVGKVVGVVGCGGEATGKGGSGVVAMEGKRVGGTVEFKRGEDTVLFGFVVGVSEEEHGESCGSGRVE